MEPATERADGREVVASVRLNVNGPAGLDRGHCGFALVFWERGEARGTYLELVANPHDPSDPYECVGGEA